jgi:ATP-dependent RNA circularization protein (DNA/RNA ligase family)
MIKFPKTYRLKSVLERDGIYTKFKNLNAVIEEKVDGANSGISFDSDGNLLLQSRGHYLEGHARERQFNLFKTWANQNIEYLFDILQDKYLLFGEWCYAKHHIFYDNLPHYFLAFDLYDKKEEKFLSNHRFKEVIKGDIIHTVPLLYEARFDKINNFGQFIKNTSLKTKDWRQKLIEMASYEEFTHTDPSDLMEGIYVKIENDDYVVDRMKNPRPEFTKAINDDDHWMDRPIVTNLLK